MSKRARDSEDVEEASGPPAKSARAELVAPDEPADDVPPHDTKVADRGRDLAAQVEAAVEALRKKRDAIDEAREKILDAFRKVSEAESDEEEALELYQFLLRQYRREHAAALDLHSRIEALPEPPIELMEAMRVNLSLFQSRRAAPTGGRGKSAVVAEVRERLLAPYAE